MADRPQITRALLVLSSLPNCPIKDGNMEIIIDAYQIVLQDLPGEELQAAAAQYLSTGTFFPTPGQLRQTALELQLAASGIPTAAEAWADVGHALRYLDAEYCPEGERLREMALDAEKAYDGEGYIRAFKQYHAHTGSCTECRAARTEEVYCHPVVEQTVRRLGGREALFTDNAAADRARFIEAYKDILTRERREYGRIPEVANFIEQRRAEIKAGGHAVEKLDGPGYQSITHDLREQG